MPTKIRRNTNKRSVVRAYRKSRIQKKLNKSERPRLLVYRSNRFLYAQVVDDAKAATVAQANTQEEAFKSMGSKKNLEAAKALGKLVAERSLKTQVESVVFDRNGYDFHGRISAIAEGAREAGLKF